MRKFEAEQIPGMEKFRWEPGRRWTLANTDPDTDRTEIFRVLKRVACAGASALVPVRVRYGFGEKQRVVFTVESRGRTTVG